MAKKITLQGNAIEIQDTVSGLLDYSLKAKDCWYDERELETNSVVKIYFINGNQFKSSKSYDLADTVDMFDATYTKLTFRDFARNTMGFNTPTGGSVGDLIFIRYIYDLPASSAGVITLEANKVYFILSNIDLLGSRLQLGENTSILGIGSENCSLTSTGLGASTALISSNYTLPMNEITIKNVGTALDIDGTGNSADLDWTAVNFLNVTNIGTIANCDNFIYDKSAILSSQGLIFDGEFNTIGIGNSILVGDSSVADNIIEVPATATINRRFRIQYSSIISAGSSLGINVNSSTTIPDEGFILDTVNFSGGGTYLSGITESSNISLFSNCVGIENSADISQYYMNSNATVTTIGATGTPVKVLGTTTSSPITRKFTNTDNRATYVGALNRFYKVTVAASVESGNNNQVGMYIAKNGTVLDESEVYATTNGAGRAENIVIQTLVALSNTDYIEIITENNTTTNDITVTDLNVIVN